MIVRMRSRRPSSLGASLPKSRLASSLTAILLDFSDAFVRGLLPDFPDGHSPAVVWEAASTNTADNKDAATLKCGCEEIYRIDSTSWQIG